MAQLGAGRVERRPVLAVAGADPFSFACQGCGAYCCTNERLILSPLELRNLVRAIGIDAGELSKRGWLAAFPDPDVGLPRVAVEFVPVKPGLTACPFLGLEAAPRPESLLPPETSAIARLEARQNAARKALAADGADGGRLLALRCQAYQGRPIMCRSFPLQFKLDLNADGTPAGWSMLAHTRCPGHDLGDPQQTIQRYVAESGVPTLAEARVAWHRLNRAIAAAGITLADHEAASGSRRALWDATLNLLFSSYDRPRLQLPDDAYTPAIHELFVRHLAPVGSIADVEERAKAGTIPHAVAAAQLRALVAACQALDAALDAPP